MKRLLIVIFTVPFLVVVISSCQQPTEPVAEEKVAQKVEPVTLKVPIAFATALPGLGSTIKWVSDRIETVSNGSVKMIIYEPGKLVPPFETLDAVSSGKINAGFAAAGYWAGKIPASPLLGRRRASTWRGSGMAMAASFTRRCMIRQDIT